MSCYNKGQIYAKLLHCNVGNGLEMNCRWETFCWECVCSVITTVCDQVWCISQL